MRRVPSPLLVLAALAASACRPPCGDVGAVCTVVGTGVSGFNGEGHAAAASWLFYPTALEVDRDERLVIVDYNNYRIRVVGDDGRLTTLAGTGTHAYAQEGPALDTPMENTIDVEVADDGTLYVAEQHASRILAIADGQLRFVAGSGTVGYGGDGGPALEASMDYVSGVEAHPDGRLFVADTENHVIREVGVDGVIRLLAGAPGEPAWVDGPFADARFDEPQRMDLHGDVLYVADSRNDAVRALDLGTGTVTTLAGTGEPGFSGDGGPAQAARLDSPWGVRVDDDGAVWIADSDNHVIRRVIDGTIETVAGSGVSGGLLDGPDPLAATFHFPVDVVVGSDGDLYVADMLNSAVRKVVLVEPD